MSKKIRSYAGLQELIRASLRAQNPEWVGPTVSRRCAKSMKLGSLS
jgi:hypothetical protein